MIDRLRNLLSGLHRDESGAAMVEFVVVFPIQLFLSLSILQFAFVAHAHLVVEQAAFMGARAGAVADCEVDGGHTDVAGWRAAGKRAAEKVAARTVGVLTSGESPAAGSPPSTQALEWQQGDGGKRGFTGARQQEAFAHLDVKFEPYPDERYVSCEVTYDYTMMIPVANHFFARTQKVFWGGPISGADYAEPSRQRGKTVFRIKRVSFIPTPWTAAPR